MRNLFAALLFLFAANSIAQDRPDEGALFGGETPAATAKPEAKPGVKSTSRATKPTLAPVSTPAPAVPSAPLPSELQSDTNRDAFASGEVSDNPLQIGGTYYHRMILTTQQDIPEADYPLSAPMQFDLFLDARPSDRIRGFIDQRLLYDSSKDQYSRPTAGTTTANILPSTTTVPNNPQTVLDQAWLKFDIDRTVFVTAGKQHLKWGTSRFWNPTDFLSTQRRDPLLPYDLRLGDTMIKFETPFEAQQFNFYAVALLDNTGPASTLGQLGLALRAEKVIGESEFGLDLVTRGRRMPVWGADVSSSLGPFDVYAEAALLTQAPGPTYKLTGTPSSGANVSTLVSSETRPGSFVQASGGINYSFAWTENRLATIGLEYFHNPLGYDDAAIYPVLILFNQFQPFYVGRDYAGLYITAEGPDAQKNTSYTFSTLSNVSDKSFLSRLDFRWRTLTYLTFETYGAVHYGSQGGEFNFTIDTPSMTYAGNTVPAVKLPRTIYELGLGLRLSF